MRAIFLTLIFSVFLMACEKPADEQPSNKIDPSLNTIVFNRYTADRSSTDLYSMKEDGTDLIRLTTIGDSTKTHLRHPKWGPDNKLYFSQIIYGANPQFQLFSMDADGSNIKQISNNTEAHLYWDLDVSRQSRQLLYSRKGALWTSDLDGKNERQVAKEESIPAASWHPDGQSFVYVALTTTQTGEHAWQLFTRRHDGTGKQQITFVDERSYDSPYFSPDGSKLCYSVLGDVHVSNSDGTGEAKLNLPNLRGGTIYGWTSDGEWILYVAIPSNNLYLIKPDGSSLKRIGADTDSFPEVSAR